MWRRKRILTRRDTHNKTPVHYAIKGDRKDIITALGSELIHHWYTESNPVDAELDAWERLYLEENFEDWIDPPPPLERVTQDEESSDDQEILSTEELWQAIKDSLDPVK
jgi:hypothetical protein